MCLLLILSNKLDLNQETCFTIHSAEFYPTEWQSEKITLNITIRSWMPLCNGTQKYGILQNNTNKNDILLHDNLAEWHSAEWYY